MDTFALCCRVSRKRISLLVVAILLATYLMLAIVHYPSVLFGEAKNYDYESGTWPNNQSDFGFRRQHSLRDIGHQRPNGTDWPSGAERGDHSASAFHVKCRNSVQGRQWIADDRGYVCPRASIRMNGCCREDPSSQRYSCHTCQESDCCAQYEFCVSCCLSPSKRPIVTLNARSESGQMRIFLSSISDHFEFCLTKCRTSSHSVLHENAYKNPLAKYCFASQASR